jgi:hypothetical protein
MSHEQIKESFLRYEDRRHKLNLLYIELLSNLKIAEELLRTANLGIKDDTSKERFLNFSPHKFEVSLLTSLLPDVYNIIYNDRETLVSLIRLRLQMLTINSKISIFHSHAPEEMEKQLDTHNEYIKNNISNDTFPLLRKIIKGLESKHSLVNPFPASHFDIFKKA